MCFCFTFYSVLKEKEFSKPTKPSFFLLCLWNFFYSLSCKSSDLSLYACSIIGTEIKNSCGWKWESQFGVVNFKVYLKTRIELTSLVSFEKRWGQQHSSLSTHQSPSLISFRGTELFIPLGLGILANVSRVAVWSHTDGSVTLYIVLKMLHLLSGCCDCRKEWYEKSSVNHGSTGECSFKTLSLPWTIIELFERIWKSPQTCAHHCFFIAFYFQNQPAFKQVLTVTIWHDLFLNICKFFSLWKKTKQTKCLIRHLTEKVSLWPWLWSFVLVLFRKVI